jgi:transposase
MATLLDECAARGIPPEQVHVCLEASGGYERDCATRLHEAGCRVSVVNPRRTAAYAKSCMLRAKTDAVDARLLARFAAREVPDLWEPTEASAHNLKQMQRGRKALVTKRTDLRNRRKRETNPAVRRAFDKVLEELDQQIEDLQEAIDRHIEQHEHLAEQRRLLMTIPGIGMQTAAGVLAELGDWQRFESARQVAAYAGLTPTHHTSGTSVRRRSRLSKMGNKHLRTAMYMPALAALRSNAAIKALAERLRSRGKAKMVVVGAAMRKLLHICYGVLKSGSPFNAALHPGT